MLRWAAPRGLTATFHWHNDRSVPHLLDVLERVNRETPIAPLRWSVAHLNDAAPESLARMKALGVGWLMQNAFYFRGEAFLGQRGAEALRLAPPIGTALRMGLTIGGGTDAHRVMSYNPFVSLQWMLDGKSVAGLPTRRSCRCNGCSTAGRSPACRPRPTRRRRGSRRCASTRRAARGSRMTRTGAVRSRSESSPISRC